jgi:hypothetical protein
MGLSSVAGGYTIMQCNIEGLGFEQTLQHIHGLDRRSKFPKEDPNKVKPMASSSVIAAQDTSVDYIVCNLLS